MNGKVPLCRGLKRRLRKALVSKESHAMLSLSRNRLGVITSGSLVDGLCARLEGRESVEDMRVGKFVVIKGEKNEFFSMITDVVLEATNQKVLVDPPNGDPFIHEVLAGTSTYGSITLKPMRRRSGSNFGRVRSSA